MLSNAALLTEVIKAAAFTAAGEVFDYRPLRREVEARMMPGFRNLDDCPEGDWVWVRGGPFNAPTLRTARGERWRRDRREGRPAPTYWAPVKPPDWDEEG